MWHRSSGAITTKGHSQLVVQPAAAATCNIAVGLHSALHSLCSPGETFVLTDSVGWWRKWGNDAGIRGCGPMEGAWRLQTEALSHLNLCLFALASGIFPGISSSPKGFWIRP